MTRRVSKRDATHIVARVSGVREGEPVAVAAQKAIDLMRSAGFSARAIRQAEAMLARAKREGRA